MGEARRRSMNETDPSKPVTRPPTGPLFDKTALTKAGFVEAPSSCFTMTPMTIAEVWDREKANLRRGFRGRQADLSPYLDLAQCDAEARRGVERLQRAARGEKRAAFDKLRKNRPSGRRLNNRLTGGMIVGVDCEGMNVGGHFILVYARDGTGSKIANAISAEDKPKFIDGGEAVYRRQRPGMFMMGGVEDQGYRDQILESSEGLKTYQMCEWFLKTAREFASKDPKGKQPVFVGYGFNYDDAQIVADLSKKKLTAISKGKPANRLDDPTCRRNPNRWEPCGDYAVAVLKGKWIKICKLRDPRHPFKKGSINYTEKIIIFDVISFFNNMSFVAALATMPGTLSDEELKTIIAGKPSQQNLVITSDMKREHPYGFKRNQFVLPDLEIINKAAYWDYQRQRVYVKSRKKSSRKRKRIAIIRGTSTPNTTIEHTRRSSCPKCQSEQVYKHGKQSRAVVDLRFTRHGIKRWTIRHSTQRYRCCSCKATFYPLDDSRPTSKYGSNLIAYAVYLNIELRLSLGRVTSNIVKLFDISLWGDKTHKFKTDTAEAYRNAYDEMLKSLCSGNLLHVDETSVSVEGTNGYVWALTSMEEVAYLYTPTREGGTIQTMLRDFKGVLVSDFYAAYDAIGCPQQKCLIHFIRDLNDDLLKHPFDNGLKRLAAEFTALLRPIVDTVDERGLRKRFLGKHKIFIDRFYKRLGGEFGSGEAVKKIVERLQKNRETMFTFLSFDGVPWNNNNAEHAVKAFANLRQVIDGTTSERGLRDYLVLLSLCETCKYKSVDFLDFLRSGSKNVTDFANSRRSRA